MKLTVLHGKNPCHATCCPLDSVFTGVRIALHNTLMDVITDEDQKEEMMAPLEVTWIFRLRRFGEIDLVFG